ncbi:hypothetical protein ACWCQV_29535, partial [Streptomyces eurythermus]
CMKTASGLPRHSSRVTWNGRVRGTVVFEVADGRVASLRGIAAAPGLVRLNEAWRRHGTGTPVISAW